MSKIASNSTNSSTTTKITRQQVAVDQRLAITATLFGSHFPMQIEPSVYSITGSLAGDYHGGYWNFYVLGNGGF